MIPKTLLFTGLILVVAMLAFGGLAYQTVSKTETNTQTETQRLFSFSPYEVTDTLTYTTTTVYLVTSISAIYWGPSNCVAGCVDYYTMTLWQTSEQTMESPFLVQQTATIPYSQTLFHTATMSSTNLVPAYAVVGLDNMGFMALAIVTIAVLAAITAWVAIGPLAHKRAKQATLTQFVRAPTSCVKCGAHLPLDSEFCNKCGAKQP